MKTYEEILQLMLEEVPNDIDKREGSLIYDALAPTAKTLAKISFDIENFRKEVFPDTAEREFLIRHAAQRGLRPFPATNAVVLGKFEPDSVDVMGRNFSINGAHYTVTERVSDGSYKLTAQLPGASVNGNFGSLLPMEFIRGLESGKIVELLIPGTDEENTEKLRERFFSRISSTAFGGNVADYKEKVLAIPGVGGVKIYRAFDGGGTVKIVFITSEFKQPDEGFAKEIKKLIDPDEGEGQGLGIAPIGHIVTVEPVGVTPIDVRIKLEFRDQRDWESVESEVKKVIAEYFHELASNWAQEKNITVRSSHINARLLNLSGVDDVKTELDETELELDKTELELDETELELDETELELDETELELDKTELELDETELELDKTELELSRIVLKADCIPIIGSVVNE